jgi:hypothetical protein
MAQQTLPRVVFGAIGDHQLAVTRYVIAPRPGNAALPFASENRT